MIIIYTYICISIYINIKKQNTIIQCLQQLHHHHLLNYHPQIKM